MTTLLRDLRLAVRVLLHTKSWTLVVLVSLALGIGANTALFTAVNGLLLQTVAVHEPDRLVRFSSAGKNDMVRSSSDYGYAGTSGTRNVRSTFSFAMFEQLRAANTTLTGLAAGSPMSVNVIVDGDAQLGSGYQASGNYFTVLGVPAALGRVFVDGDDNVSAPPVAVISHAYWQKRFAGQPSAINRVVSINGQMVTIVGVTPPDFAGIQRLGAEAPDVTVPLAFDAVFNPPQPLPDAKVPIPRMTQPTHWWLQLVGRLKAGTSLEQASANFTTVFERTAKAGMAEYESSLTAEEKALSNNRQRGDARAGAPRQVGRARLLRHRSAGAAVRRVPRRRRDHRPADRLRQRREPAAVARDDAASRDLGPPLDGRDARPAGPPAADREPPALEPGRRARRARRLLVARAAAVRREGAARLAGVRVRRRRQPAHRHRLRPPAGAARNRRGSGWRDEGEQPQRHRVAHHPQQGAGRAAGRDVRGAARRRRPVPADAREPEERGRRVRLEEPADVQRESGRQPLRSGALGAGLPPGARSHVVPARRDGHGADAHDAALGQHEHELDVDAGPDVARPPPKRTCT